MDLVMLENYGRIFKRYIGEGQVVDTEGGVHTLPVEAAVTQDANLVCSFHGWLPNEILFEPPTPSVVSIEGLSVTTSDLREVFANAHIGGETVDGLNSQIICLTKDLLIGTRDVDPPEIRYYVTNLKIATRFDIEVDFHRVRIEPLPRYSDEIRHLRASKGTAVTCLLRVTRGDGQPLAYQVTDRMIDDMCSLLSLARGTTVTWVTAEWESQGAINSYHRNVKTSKYGNLNIILSNPITDLKAFLLHSYPCYQESRDQWGLPQAIRHFVDGLEESGYVELRTLKLTILLDYLKGRFSDLFDHGGYLIEPDVFRRRKRRVQRRLKALLREEFPEYPVAVSGEMSQHVAGFFRRSFRAGLERMLKHIRLSVPSDELERFVAIRNRVVHEASLLPVETHGSTWSQYMAVLSLVSRVFLAVLQYHGYYYDWARHVPGEWEGPEMTGRLRLELTAPPPGEQ